MTMSIFTSHTLENTKAVLEKMGHPERRMKLIHVAGSNGKGSVCAYLSSILTTAGKQTGLFTSPHLVDINERFQINQENVSNELFLEAFEAVMDMFHFVASMKRSNLHPSIICGFQKGFPKHRLYSHVNSIL